MAAWFQSWEVIAALGLGVLLLAVIVTALLLVIRRRRPRRRASSGRTAAAHHRGSASASRRRNAGFAVSVGLAVLSLCLVLVILWLVTLLQQARTGIVADGPDIPASDLAGRLAERERELADLRQALSEARAALAIAQGQATAALDEQRRLFEARINQLELAGAENDERCLRRLASLDMEYVRIPDSEQKVEIEGVETLQCAIHNAVRVTRVGKATLSTAAPMTCRLAELLAAYERDIIQPTADELFHQPVTRINHLGTYNCRTIAGSRTISEHAFANGIDLAGFEFADGRVVRIREDWDTPTDNAAFARRIGFGACQTFAVVLTPEANAAHEDHLHLDAGRGSECR